MRLILRYKQEILSFLFLIPVYFFSRLFNIMTLPIFTDEAIYTRWSQIGGMDTNWRFIALTDGKQPLFTWFDMAVMRIVKDPLLSGRLVSVFAGFGTFVGLYFLGKEVFKNKYIGLICSFLYLIYPFGLVYDRMALYDSLVGTFAVWGLYFAILLVRTVRLDVAYTLGLIAGLGTLNKTSGFATIYFLPFTALIFDFKQKNLRNRFVKWIIFAGVAAILTYALYSILRLSPFYYLIDQKNATFFYPVREWLKHPFTFFIGNMRGLLDWLVSYMSWPFVLLIAASFFVSKKYFREKIFLLVWFAIPLVLTALDGKVLYPRYILFMTLALIPLVAFSLSWIYEKIKNPLVWVLVLILFCVIPIYSCYTVLVDFPHANIAKPDLGQYINDWPAGGGVKEMVNFLSDQSKKGKLYVATEGTFGSVPTLGVEIYLNENKNIEKRGIWPVPENIPTDLLEKSKTERVYFVFDQTQTPPLSWIKYLQFIAKFQKGIGDKYLSIYQIYFKIK